jgi:hypothetical protein
MGGFCGFIALKMMTLAYVIIGALSGLAFGNMIRSNILEAFTAPPSGAIHVRIDFANNQ